MTSWGVTVDQGNTYIHLKSEDPIPLDIEFSCNSGEIFVIVGPSGSGKTTILRSISGLYTPGSGKIVCMGNNWFDSQENINVSVQSRAAGFVFQDYALFPHLSVSENISIPILEEDKSIRNKLIDEYIELVHLTGLDDRLPHQLSGGQQQRVAVARAMARKPDILLLDEPFSSVDQQTRRFLVRELIQLKHKLNIPIIHVTHDLNEARRIADKLCIIYEGTGLQLDKPENVMARPNSSRVASLTGHDNIYHGKIIKHDSESKSSYIQWHDKILTTSYSPKFETGEEIDWMIPSSQVIAKIDLNNTHTDENQLSGKIIEMIQLGEGTIISIEFENNTDYLHMNYSTHHVKKNQIATGDKITVSLIADGIHIMKCRQ